MEASRGPKATTIVPRVPLLSNRLPMYLPQLSIIVLGLIDLVTSLTNNWWESYGLSKHQLPKRIIFPNALLQPKARILLSLMHQLSSLSHCPSLPFLTIPIHSIPPSPLSACPH